MHHPICVSTLRSFLRAGVPGWAELLRVHDSVRLCYHANDPEGWRESCEIAAAGLVSPAEIYRMRVGAWDLRNLDLADCDPEVRDPVFRTWSRPLGRL